MLYQPLKDVFQPRIWTIAVDRLDIIGDVVDCQVLNMRYVHFRRIHDDRSTSVWSNVDYALLDGDLNTKSPTSGYCDLLCECDDEFSK